MNGEIILFDSIGKASIYLNEDHRKLSEYLLKGKQISNEYKIEYAK